MTWLGARELTGVEDAYYQLLAPQELNTMVEQMFLDETQIV